MLKKIVVALVVTAAAVGGFFGGKITANPTTSDEYKSLASDLKASKETLSDTEQELTQTAAKLEALTSDNQGAVVDAGDAAVSGEVAIAPRNIKIAIRTREKECFGSAGCNVTVQIDPDYVGNQDVSTGSWEITYEIRGGEDGPQVETMTLEDGTFSFPEEQDLSTSSSSAKLTAVVTSVYAND